METTQRTPAQISHDVHLATNEVTEVMKAVAEIVQNVNSSINENVAALAAKYGIGEKHLRKMAQVRLLKFDTDK
jgi:hypothetical protein